MVDNRFTGQVDNLPDIVDSVPDFVDIFLKVLATENTAACKVRDYSANSGHFSDNSSFSTSFSVHLSAHERRLESAVRCCSEAVCYCRRQ